MQKITAVGPVHVQKIGSVIRGHDGAVCLEFRAVSEMLLNVTIFICQLIFWMYEAKSYKVNLQTFFRMAMEVNCHGVSM